MEDYLIALRSRDNTPAALIRMDKDHEALMIDNYTSDIQRKIKGMLLFPFFHSCRETIYPHENLPKLKKSERYYFPLGFWVVDVFVYTRMCKPVKGTQTQIPDLNSRSLFIFLEREMERMEEKKQRIEERKKEEQISETVPTHSETLQTTALPPAMDMGVVDSGKKTLKIEVHATATHHHEQLEPVIAHAQTHEISHTSSVSQQTTSRFQYQQYNQSWTK